VGQRGGAINAANALIAGIVDKCIYRITNTGLTMGALIRSR
jgi:hypothetical protein